MEGNWRLNGGYMEGKNLVRTARSATNELCFPPHRRSLPGSRLPEPATGIARCKCP
jgi:hypothetical protein